MDPTKRSFGSQFGHVADVAVGDVILGGLGRAGFHLGKVPGVAKAGAYIRENVSDGYKAAETAEKKRRAVHALREIVSKGVAMSPEVLRSIAEQNGLDSKALDEIVETAKRVAGKGKPDGSGEIPTPNGDGTYAAPASA